MDFCITNILYGCDLDYGPINQYCNRTFLENIFKKLENHLVKYCYYCNDCDFCNAYVIRCVEYKRMGFWTHN